MKPWRITLPAALLVLAAWLLLTIGSGLLIARGRHASLAQTAADGIGLPWMLAAAFALAVAWRAGPQATGLGAPAPLSSIRLVWLPLTYAGLMLLFDLVVGVPPPATILVLACNMVLVGLSEELMFRGILFHGLLTRFRIWPAVLMTSLLFGMVHALNFFGTGQLEQALMQSLTAFMQGVAYLAIRIRTRSVWPMVTVHAMWDFSLMLGGVNHPAAGAGAGWSILPFLIALPVFLYGLFLLRHLQRDYSDWSDAVPSAIPYKGSS